MYVLRIGAEIWVEAGAVAGIAPTSDDGRVTLSLSPLICDSMRAHFESITSCSECVFDALKTTISFSVPVRSLTDILVDWPMRQLRKLLRNSSPAFRVMLLL